MTVTVAKSAGFCFGVKRAVSLVYEEAEKNAKVYTMGPIIHNEIVTSDLARKGVRILDDSLICEEEQSQPDPGATVILRSHGVPRQMARTLEEGGYRVVDATCPFVRKIHQIVSEKSREGLPVIIIGDPKHPEVIGIRGWAEGPCEVIESEKDAEILDFDKNRPVCIVSQTTFNFQKFQELVEIVKSLGYHVIVTDTVCNATHERQAEAMELAKASDVMLVIGGKHSSNTQKLYDICTSQCMRTYFVSSPEDLKGICFRAEDKVGITAGASTPNTIIQEVSLHVRRAEL